MSETGGMDAPIDNLSAIGRKLLRFNRERAYQDLVVPGDGNAEARDILETLKPADLIAGTISDHAAAAGVLAGLWLWHDWLDESHRICQAIETPSGSFWHAIMHRREGDFSNSKYWYARAGRHEVYPAISSNAVDMLNPLPLDKAWVRLTNGGWNPEQFVDLVRDASADAVDPRRPVLVNLQQLEWRMLFDHCVRQSVQ
jgi:hypothetical protein